MLDQHLMEMVNQIHLKCETFGFADQSAFTRQQPCFLNPMSSIMFLSKLVLLRLISEVEAEIIEVTLITDAKILPSSDLLKAIKELHIAVQSCESSDQLQQVLTRTENVTSLLSAYIESVLDQLPDHYQKSL